MNVRSGLTTTNLELGLAQSRQLKCVEAYTYSLGRGYAAEEINCLGTSPAPLDAGGSALHRPGGGYRGHHGAWRREATRALLRERRPGSCVLGGRVHDAQGRDNDDEGPHHTGGGEAGSRGQRNGLGYRRAGALVLRLGTGIGFCHRSSVHSGLSSVILCQSRRNSLSPISRSRLCVQSSSSLAHRQARCV